MLVSFVSASSSRLDPHSTCSRRFLAGCNARSSLGLRAHRQPDKPVQRLGTLSCLRACVPVLLDQRFAIDPCPPSLVSFESSVIWLEPRTPHQSAKLKNVPKNEYLFTLFSFSVNQNCAFLSLAKSIECSWFTARCRILVQWSRRNLRNPRCFRGFPHIRESEDRFFRHTHANLVVWKSRHKTEIMRRYEVRKDVRTFFRGGSSCDGCRFSQRPLRDFSAYSAF